MPFGVGTIPCRVVPCVAGCALAAAVAMVCPVSAETRLPGLLSDGCVLQRDVPLLAWGWDEPGALVEVRFRDQVRQTLTGPKGRWYIHLEPEKAGGPDTLAVAGTTDVTVADVLVGDVWFCSGQSNMAFTVSRSLQPEEEIGNADFPQLRLATLTRAAAAQPQEDGAHGGWKPATPELVGGFSAAAYFFGREIHRETGVPVGLVNASWGGTCIEAWMPREALKQIPSGVEMLQAVAERAAAYDHNLAEKAYTEALEAWRTAAAAAKEKGKNAPRKPLPPVPPGLDRNDPSTLHNAMVHPWHRYPVRGFLWYQGERNCNDLQSAYDYRRELPAMIESWRAGWSDESLPFYFVQLPNFARKPNPCLPLIRESMELALETPGTGMAVTIDIGDSTDIHPPNKQEVGRRLALLALHRVYKKKVLDAAPVMARMKIRKGRAYVTFASVRSALKLRGDGTEAFEVAGEDRAFVPAEAALRGSTLVLWSVDVPKPVAVRYAWTGDPTARLFTTDGLPVPPFRSDSWPIEGVVER